MYPESRRKTAFISVDFLVILLVIACFGSTAIGIFLKLCGVDTFTWLQTFMPVIGFLVLAVVAVCVYGVVFIRIFLCFIN